MRCFSSGSRGALFLFLVEGLTEYLVYSKALTKLCNARKIGFEDLPKPIRDFLGPLRNRNNDDRRRNNDVYALDDRRFLFLVEGGGFNGVEIIIKRIISRNELQQIIKEFDVNIVIAIDKDVGFRDRINNILRNLRNCRSGACSGAVCSWDCGSGLGVHLFEQGLDDELSTGEFEDLFVKLVEAWRLDLKSYIDELDRRLSEQGKRLNYKRRLFVYLALLSDKPKLRSYDMLRGIVDDVDDGHLKSVFGGVLGLLGCP